jgi:DNA-binding Lrp family transcriptional regulator
MDLKDKKLLYLLDLDSRMKESELAKQMTTSKQVVNYRIKKLEKQGIIKKFQTVLNLETLGVHIYANVYFKIKGAKNKEATIINSLIKNNNVGYIASLGGKFDLSIVLVARNIQELEEHLNKIVSKYPLELRDYLVSIRILGFKFHKKYLSQNKQGRLKQILTKNEHSIKLDSLDKRILKDLSLSSRKPIIDISEKIKKPFSTVRNRIKLLEDRGVIAGYSLLFDLNKINMQNYKVFIKVRDKSQEAYNKLLTYASNHENIIWFFKTLGDHDYELRIEAENQEQYHQIIKNLKNEFIGMIEDVETLIVFEELKEDYSVILNEL